jgi:hypothetical protein
VVLGLAAAGAGPHLVGAARSLWMVSDGVISRQPPSQPASISRSTRALSLDAAVAADDLG